MRVLVVDDEAEAREIVSTILSQAQAETRTAESAVQALNVMDEWRPDVLVADIAMPEADGYELIRKVRAGPSKKDARIPAVALTAYSRTEDRVRALLAGYQTHIAKPIEPAELITVVASMADTISSI